MAEAGDDAKSGKSRFLSKSKWGKVFREREPHEQPSHPAHVDSFKLTDDVADFLKPSTDRSAALRPKINVAIAQRWPNAHEVRAIPAGEDGSNSPIVSAAVANRYTKPTRRKGLAVSFAKTPPEVIGEGGEEAIDPVAEIGRARATMRRAASAKHHGYSGSGSQKWDPNEGDGESIPVLRRVQTTQDDLSFGPQKRQGSQSGSDRRVPSINAPELGLETSGSGQEAPPRQVSRPGGDPALLGAKRRTEQMSEGRAFRRASALFAPENDSGNLQDYTRGIQPSPKLYDELSRLDALDSSGPSLDSRRSGSNLRDQSVAHAQGSRTHDELQAQRQDHRDRPAVSAPPQREPRLPQLEPPATGQNGNPNTARSNHGPSYMRAAQSQSDSQRQRGPPPPRIQAGDMRSSPVNQRPTQARPMPPPSPRSMNSQGFPPQNPADPTNGQRQHYSGHNSSNTSLNRPSPSPRIGSSSADSRDDSPPPHFPTNEQRGYAVGVPPPISGMPDRNPQMKSPSSSLTPRDASADSRNRAPSSAAHAAALAAAGVSQPRPQASRSPSNSPRVVQNFSFPQSLQKQPNTVTREEPARQMQQPLAERNQEPASQPQDATTNATNLSAKEATSREQPMSRQESMVRQVQTSSAETTAGRARNTSAPLSPTLSNPAHDAAGADFAARVAHMSGVFKLTAEREQPADRSTPEAWLRAGIWWYLKGKIGIDGLVQQSRADGRQPQELLMQPHVDLAKVWWILSDHLGQFDSQQDPYARNTSNGNIDAIVRQSATVLASHLKSLCLLMGRSQLMPPERSLIQGQNTSIWQIYPRFAPEVVDVLAGGNTRNGATGDPSIQEYTPAFDMLPLGDTKNTFCYGRFGVEASVSTDQIDTDRVIFPCILTILRGRSQYSPRIVIAGQSDIVNISLGSKDENPNSVSWNDVTWKRESAVFAIHLPRGFDVSVRMHERDFRSVWHFCQETRALDRTACAENGEQLVFEASVPELQYADPSRQSTFPQDKIRDGVVMVFERSVTAQVGGHTKHSHTGYRLLIATDPKHRVLGHVSHEIGQDSPLLFEFMTDSSAKNGMVAMVVRLRRDPHQCKLLLVFADVDARQSFTDVLCGLAPGREEKVIGKASLTSITIAPSSQLDGEALSSRSAFTAMDWRGFSVINSIHEDISDRTTERIFSRSLRVVAWHGAGCVTDRMNLGKGEMLIRLPTSMTPAVHMLREPQDDLSMSIDPRRAPAVVVDESSELMQLVQAEQTIRTLLFPTIDDMHTFQAAATGFIVHFDGIATSFSISRRRMVVALHKKLTATRTRVQIVARGAVFNVLAFMDNFSHAEALCFQVKSTDVFELIKGNGKDKKPGVKLVDAKFSLPPGAEKGEEGADAEQLQQQNLRRRFINLDGLDYAEEHDDIMVEFDAEQERDSFAHALPAATTLSKGLTLRRRI